MSDNAAHYSKFFQAPKSTEESEEELRSYAKHKELISSLPCVRGFLYSYRGFWFMEHHLLGLLSAHQHFTASPDDIFLITYPKSGTTWIRALAFAVVNRHHAIDNVHPLFTMHPQDADCAVNLGVFSGPRVPDLNVMATPRIFATHVPFSLLPDSINNCGRILYVIRDPKDVLVSMWFFANSIISSNPDRKITKPLAELFEDFCGGRTVYGPIWDHQMEYKVEALRRPETTLVLEYEKMKANPEESVRKLACFLGRPFTEEEEAAGAVEETVRLCSIESLKELEVNKEGEQDMAPGIKTIKNSSYFREGKAGGWKEHLTAEMAHKIDQITQHKLIEYGLV